MTAAVSIDDTRTTVGKFTAAWIAGDIETAIQYVAEDAIYALYISDEVLPVGGETRGRSNIKAALHTMRDQFEYLLYRPYNLVVAGEKARFRVEHMYRHKKSGETLTGNFRIVALVKDGLIYRADEYHDRAMVESFMRLFANG